MILLVFVWAQISAWFLKDSAREKLWKIGNIIGVLSMTAIIIGVTISSRNTGVSEIYWQPFYSFQAAKEQPEMYRSMLMNVFLFFPLGLMMPYALPKNWNGKALLTILFALALSVGIEYLQYRFQLGRTETDDVICNTLGCLIGSLSYQIKVVVAS